MPGKYDNGNGVQKNRARIVGDKSTKANKGFCPWQLYNNDTETKCSRGFFKPSISNAYSTQPNVAFRENIKSTKTNTY